jgi:hypothetical protein
MMAHSRYDGIQPPRKAVIKGYIEIQDTTQVDGATWYTIQVNPRVSPWIKEQHKDLWYSHITPNQYKVVDTFDVHEKLYSMLALRWS